MMSVDGSESFRGPLEVHCIAGKSTCSGFKTGLFISYHFGNAVRYIKLRGYSIKDSRKSDYFDTKYMTVLPK